MARNIKGITIEIEGKTSGLVKSLNEANKAIRDTESQLRQVNKALKLDPGNADLIKAKQNALAKEIEETKKKLDAEKQAAEDAAEALQKGTITQGEYDALQADIALTTNKLKGLEKEAKNSSSVLGEQMKAAGGKIQEVGGKISEVGESLLPVTGAMAGIGTAVVGVAANFETEMSKVAAISGTSGDTLEELSEKAREMGATTQFSAAESAEAFKYMAMAGWDAEQMMSGISGVLNLAAASGAELATTSDIVTDAMTAMGYSADQAGHFADVLATASTNSNTNVEMLGESFKYVAPLAGSMGYSIEDVATALGLMANSGIKASSAGTALRTLLTNMAKPTAEMADSMDQLGISLQDSDGNMKSLGQIMRELRAGFGELKMPIGEFQTSLAELDTSLEEGSITQKEYDKRLSELTERAYGAEGALKAQTAAALAGKQGLSGLMAIVNASDEDFNKLTGAINNSEGAAQNMADVMNDNLGGDIKKLKSAIEELAISLGSIIIPVIRDVVGVIQGLVDKFNGLSEPVKRAIVVIAGIAGALGPVLIVIGKLVGFIGSVVTALGAIAPVVSAIGVTVGGFVTATLLPILPIIAGIIAGITALILVIKNWDKIVEVAKKIFEKVSSAIKTAATAVKTAVSNAFTAAGRAVKAALDAMYQWAIGAKVKVLEAFVALGKGIAERASGIFNAVKTGVSKAIEFLKGLPRQAITWGADLIRNFVTGIKNNVGKVIQAIKNMGQKIRDFIGFSEPEKGPLSNFHTYAPDMMKLFAKGIRDNTGLVTNAVSGAASGAAAAMQTDYSGVLNQIATNTGTAAVNTGRASGDINVTLKVGSQQFGRAVVTAQRLTDLRNGGR